MYHLRKFQKIGRPNTETKRAKRRRQKAKQCSKHKSPAPLSSEDIPSNVIDVADDAGRNDLTSNSVNDNTRVHSKFYYFPTSEIHFQL